MTALVYQTGVGRAGMRGWVRRLGARLFAGPDARARQYGWEITERWGGLARTYRDPRLRSHLRKLAATPNVERMTHR